jgi:hypothetical protein
MKICLRRSPIQRNMYNENTLFDFHWSSTNCGMLPPKQKSLPPKMFHVTRHLLHGLFLYSGKRSLLTLLMLKYFLSYVFIVPLFTFLTFF